MRCARVKTRRELRCGLLHFFEGGSKELVLNPFVVVFDAVCSRGFQDERRRAHSADHAGLEVEELCAWYVLAARGLVVQQIDAVELRVVAAAVLAVAADAVLIAKHLLKLGAHVATALARLYVHNLARKSSLEAGSTQVKKAGRSGET